MPYLLISNLEWKPYFLKKLYFYIFFRNKKENEWNGAPLAPLPPLKIEKKFKNPLEALKTHFKSILLLYFFLSSNSFRSYGNKIFAQL